jgi:hypothetical protein
MNDDDESGIVLWLSDTAICRLLRHDEQPQYEVRIDANSGGSRQFFSDDQEASDYAVRQMHLHGERGPARAGSLSR